VRKEISTVRAKAEDAAKEKAKSAKAKKVPPKAKKK